MKRVSHFLKKYALEGVLLFVVSLFLYIEQLDVLFVGGILLAYVFTVLLINDTFLYRGLKRGLRDVKKQYLYFFLIAITFTLMLIWKFNLEAIIFLNLFLFFTLYEWDSRITAAGAFVCLASCPVLLILKQDNYAEQAAVYAYYFLVITVILQIIEYKRHPERFEGEEGENK